MALRTIRQRVEYWIRWRRRARELAEEIETHRSLRQVALEQQGMSAADAATASRRALGNMTLAVEDARDVWIVRAFHEFSRDLRHGARLLRRHPGFTFAAVLSLALGIGGNTAVFSLMDAVMLKSLPVDKPDELVVLTRVNTRGQASNMTYPIFERLRQADDVFAGALAALDGTYSIDLAGSETAIVEGKAEVQAVSGNYFDVLGVHTTVGRLLTPEDDRRAQSEPVAVISDRFWKRRFGGELAAIGRRLVLRHVSFTIVGVAPAGFFGEAVGRAPDVWVPITIQPALDPPGVLTDPRVGWIRVMARLHDGITVEQANAAMSARLQNFKADSGAFGQSLRHVGAITVEPGWRGLSDTRTRFSQQLWILTTAVGLVLLIACANVANLLLVRGAARRHETVIRLAIGAGRGRLVRQFLTESALLAFIGAACGVLLAWWGSRALLLLASGGPNPLAIDVAPNLRIVGFTFSLSLLTVLLFGLAPASTATRYITGSLKPIAGGPRLLLPRVLLVAQVGLSLLLLTGAGLFLKTLGNLRALDLGFAADEIVQVAMNPQGAGYSRDQLPELYRRVLERVSAIPGIRSAAMSTSGFRTGSSRTCCIAIEGHIPAQGEEREVQTMDVTSEYFRTMGVPLLKGRTFNQGEAERAMQGAARVAIVNEALAKQFYGTTDVVGKRFGWGDPTHAKYDTEIVGVAKNAVYGDLRVGPRPLIYYPADGDRFLTVRAALPVASIVGGVRREIHAIDPNIDFAARSMPEILEQSLVMERLLARLSTFFGAIALALASIGLYGLMAYSVARRTKDIGIRVALGARRRQVVVHVLIETLGLAGAGILTGIVAALTTTRLVASALFGVGPNDPGTLLLATSTLLVVATLSAAIPARRAARIEPSVALRHD